MRSWVPHTAIAHLTAFITVGGVWKIVHDVPTGQPTAAEPLVN